MATVVTGSSYADERTGSARLTPENSDKLGIAAASA
jgi:hypothetical protein